MKIFSAAQIKECDVLTIQHEGITSYELMERAAKACYSWLAAHYSKSTPILVLCGMGNNGGDGLALTRLLIHHGFSAKAVVLKYKELFSKDASTNLALLHEANAASIQILTEGMFLTELAEDILIVDAVFGTGLNRPFTHWLAEFVTSINELSNEVVAIDLPSGLLSDALPESLSAVIQTAHTLSFQFSKRTFFHQEAERYIGQVHLLDLRLNEQFIEQTHTQFATIDIELAKSIYKPRTPFGHKGTFGSAVLVGGSYGKIGAIALSTNAALRAGAGLVFTHAPTCGYTILQQLNPEAMFVADGDNFVTVIDMDAGVNAIGIGPGMGTDNETTTALLNFINRWKTPLVLDADALNIIASNKDVLHNIPPNSILTPHPKEFERLFGTTNNSMAQVELARAKAMKHNIYIVLKGHHTAVLTPAGECWYNTSGNAGMATGGSGDVLTGIITGLLAQGYSSKEAALLGVYLHGLAGDLAAQDLSQEAMIAGDIINYLGKAYLHLQ